MYDFNVKRLSLYMRTQKRESQKPTKIFCMIYYKNFKNQTVRAKILLNRSEIVEIIFPPKRIKFTDEIDFEKVYDVKNLKFLK